MKFSEGKLYNGYFRSEIDSIDDYKVEEVAKDYIDLLIGGYVKARITIIEPGKKIQIRFNNNGTISNLDFVIDSEWEKLIGW